MALTLKVVALGLPQLLHLIRPPLYRSATTSQEVLQPVRSTDTFSHRHLHARISQPATAANKVGFHQQRRIRSRSTHTGKTINREGLRGTEVSLSPHGYISSCRTHLFHEQPYHASTSGTRKSDSLLETLVYLKCNSDVSQRGILHMRDALNIRVV